MPRFQVQVNKCKACEKTVYPMEELLADNEHFHKACFRCNKCNRTLSTGTYASLDGAIFCKPHFLQLFKQKGNYEEGFGKERYKNKWNGPGSKLEITSGGQTVMVKEDANTVEQANGSADVEEDEAEKENIANGSSRFADTSASVANGSHSHDTSDHDDVDEDSTDGGVEEERTPISLEYKKSKLFQQSSSQQEPQAKQNVPGKLKSWQPVSSREDDDSTPSKPKPAPKKLNVNWAARTQERAADKEDDQPLKFTDLGGVKNKFENGELGKKDFKSEARNEVVQVAQGTAQSTKDRFENRQAKSYDSTKRKELEELKMARTMAANRPAAQEDDGDEIDSRVAAEQSRYLELEEFKKAAAAKQNLSKFESGAFSNVEQQEIETRKEVETILGTGKAVDTLKKYETGTFEKTEYVSPVKQELVTIKADTSSKKSLYESGEVQREYESEAKKELTSINVAAGETRNKFESGELLSSQTSQNDERLSELEQVRSVSASGDKKNKFESGELIKTEFDSETKRELETIKTDAADVKTKYETGELIRTEFDSEVKKELETMSTGAMDKKNKYESGELEEREYDSVARQEAEEVKRLASSASTRSKYNEAVQEGNKVITSKPVTIEKAPPGEDPFLNRDEDEDFRIQSDNDEEMADEAAGGTSEADQEYVPKTEPKRMTNIEERFKKPEVEKPAPNVNKIQIPTFEKQADSDEELNGDVPDEEEAARLKEQMWPKKTSNIKAVFESKGQEDDTPKETPKPIDLEAEINAYTEHMKKNKPRRHKSNRSRKGSSASEDANQAAAESAANSSSLQVNDNVRS